jgi:hypothetical protein
MKFLKTNTPWQESGSTSRFNSGILYDKNFYIYVRLPEGKAIGDPTGISII